MTSAQRAASEFQPAQRVNGLPYGYVLLKMILPPITRAIEAHDRTLAACAQARIIIALEQFYVDGGRYPASLDELVPEYLAELPRDPATGEPFTYERAPEEGPALGPYYLGPAATDEAPTAETPNPAPAP